MLCVLLSIFLFLCVCVCVFAFFDLCPVKRWEKCVCVCVSDLLLLVWLRIKKPPIFHRQRCCPDTRTKNFSLSSSLLLLLLQLSNTTIGTCSSLGLLPYTCNSFFVYTTIDLLLESSPRVAYCVFAGIRENHSVRLTVAYFTITVQALHLRTLHMLCSIGWVWMAPIASPNRRHLSVWGV